MPNGEIPTIDEHFIPRMYYRGFSEIKTVRKKEKAFIWEYDIKSKRQIPSQVNVNSICVKKDLYELKDNSGNYIARNIIENAFKEIEYAASIVINKIHDIASNSKVYTVNLSLSDKEKGILTILIVALKYRDPWTIEKGIQIAQELFPDFDLTSARNWVLSSLLPLGVNQEWDAGTLVKSALGRYVDMSIRIGVTCNDEIITSDNPIIERKPGEFEQCGEKGVVIFPLTSKLVLFLFPVGTNYPSVDEELFKLSNEQIMEIQKEVALYAHEWIYSREKLSEEQLKIIVETRRGLGKSEHGI